MLHLHPPKRIRVLLRQRGEQSHARHRHDGDVNIEEVVLQTRKREQHEKGSPSHNAPMSHARFLQRVPRPCFIDKSVDVRPAGERLRRDFFFQSDPPFKGPRTLSARHDKGTAGDPAIVRPDGLLDRRLCVPAFRQVCPYRHQHSSEALAIAQTQRMENRAKVTTCSSIS
jgi:hypothetical protein